ncbi:MAG: dihydrofolate reductase family protein [Solirubrobacterales bacterium]
MTATLTQLIPERREIDAQQAYGGLELADLAPSDRPYVVANMVSSADGSAVLSGRSAGVSNDLDRELFHVLRTQTDAIMAGTATMAIEHYGPLVPESERRKRRESLGLAATPIALTATRTMNLPVKAPLFQDPSSRVIVLTCCEDDVPDCAASVTAVRTPGKTIDFDAAMRRLRAEQSIRSILLEGGPTLLGSMVAAGVVDELFLTLSPLVAGGEAGTTIVEGAPLPGPVALGLQSAYLARDSLFLRYALRS